jgi:starch synthase
MRVTYNSPNRSHHYRYAAALARARALESFVCGFSRFSSRAALPEAKGRLVRADHVQNVYLAALRLHLPASLTDELAYRSKLWIDRQSERPARASDLFLFYSGAGLSTVRRLRQSRTVCVVEAVNCHVRLQERIMREEYGRLGLPFAGFHAREMARRVEEYALADAVLCPSHFVRDSFLQEGWDADRVHVVPYGIPMSDGRNTTRLPDDGIFRVLYVGQLSPRKGLRYLMEAFDLLRHPHKELVIVGPRSEPSGLEGVAIPAGVRFTGVLKGEELAAAYRSAHVFVLPTVEEGLALVLGEALGHGTPVIATVNSGGSDLFEDGREGFLVPIRDPAALADRMQCLADDPALRARMSEAAVARSQVIGGWERTDRLLLAALEKMVQTGRKQPGNFTAVTT